MRYLALSAVALTSLSGCLMHEHRQYHPGVNPLSTGEVISLTQEGKSEDQILLAIQRNGVERKPSSDDLVEMQTAGVPSRVMAGMVDAPVREARPPVETRTKYYYDPSPDLINFGFGMLTGYLIWRHCR